MPVRIFTDSASEYQSSDHPALEVLPLKVAIGDDLFHEGEDLSHERFYELLAERPEHPTSGQVTPFVFGEAIGRALEEGDDVVVITMSSALSGTYQSACIAAEGARGKSAGTVRVVDSLNMTLGERIVVQYALQLLDAGATADEIADALEANVGRVHIFGLIDTLEYLKRGGRISAAAGTVGELLSIKPVITVTDGAVVILGKARGAKGGRTLLHREIAKRCSIARSRTWVGSTSRCPARWATRAPPMPSCASSSTSTAICGKGPSPRRSCRSPRWEPQSAAMWGPAASRSRSTARSRRRFLQWSQASVGTRCAAVSILCQPGDEPS